VRPWLIAVAVALAVYVVAIAALYLAGRRTAARELATLVPNLLVLFKGLVTDGRVSYHNEGISIAHVVPEALDGGGLAAIRTGDWIYLDLAGGEFQVVIHSTRGYKVLAAKELASRADRKKRINELQRRRQELLPSFRILLEQVSSAEAGVSPVIKNN